VPDTVLVQVRMGKRVALTVEAWPGREFIGTVTTIPAAADMMRTCLCCF